MNTKREMRKEAVERLKSAISVEGEHLSYGRVIEVLSGRPTYTEGAGVYAETLIDLLTEDDDVCRCRNCIATKRNNDLVELLKDAAKDYQHERSEVEWQKELYRSLSDHVISDTMLLPHDADDEVIHIGDEMVVGDYRYIVDGVGLAGNTDVFFVTDGDKSECFPAKVCHHYHKPTVDEILDELEGMRGTGDYEDVIKRCAELGRTLRELLKEETCE